MPCKELDRGRGWSKRWKYEVESTGNETRNLYSLNEGRESEKT